MMIDNRDETLALQEAYANIYNEIVKLDRIFVATQYFRRKWLLLLGSSLAWVIIDLRQYFSSKLTATFLTGKSDEELHRIREWVIYTRQAKGLKNPAGFLRSRLESGEFAPVLEKIT